MKNTLISLMTLILITCMCAPAAWSADDADMTNWVKAGGALIRIRPEPLSTIDGSKEWQSKLFGPASTVLSTSWEQAKQLGKGYTLLIPDAYRTRKEIAGVMDRLLSGIGSLGLGFVAPPRVSGAPELYGCLMQASFMLLNANPSPVTAVYDIPLPGGKRMPGSVLMPGYSNTRLSWSSEL